MGGHSCHLHQNHISRPARTTCYFAQTHSLPGMPPSSALPLPHMDVSSETLWFRDPPSPKGGKSGGRAMRVVATEMQFPSRLTF